MKLPNDLIKATDYSKVKNREIYEFEYRNGKYIHKYVLGGEHELTPQEIVDCLNAISTIDCDLQTAYAFIQGQKDKISDLEAKLTESEKESNARYESWQEEIRECDRLRVVLAEKEKAIENWQTMYESVVKTCYNDKEEIERMNKQLALSEKQCELMAQHIREDLKCDDDEDTIYDYFKEQAREIMKSE